MKSKSEYLQKLERNMSEYLDKIDNPKILELGVRHGISTNFFLSYCEKKNGKLFSVDIEDFSNAANSPKWTFLKCRDDDYDKIISSFGDEFDLIYIDSFHNAKHVSKIIHLYFNHLKLNRCIFVDDISWIPYSKNNIRDNFNSEINNFETFYEILNILNSNSDKILVNFDFNSSGFCRINKIKNSSLIKNKDIILRNHSIKNYIRKLFQK